MEWYDHVYAFIKSKHYWQLLWALMFVSYLWVLFQWRKANKRWRHQLDKNIDQSFAAMKAHNTFNRRIRAITVDKEDLQSRLNTTKSNLDHVSAALNGMELKLGTLREENNQLRERIIELEDIA